MMFFSLSCDMYCLENNQSRVAFVLGYVHTTQQLLFLEPEWAIDSEAMRARGIIVLVKSN